MTGKRNRITPTRSTLAARFRLLSIGGYAIVSATGQQKQRQRQGQHLYKQILLFHCYFSFS